MKLLIENWRNFINEEEEISPGDNPAAKQAANRKDFADL